MIAAALTEVLSKCAVLVPKEYESNTIPATHNFEDILKYIKLNNFHSKPQIEQHNLCHFILYNILNIVFSTLVSIIIEYDPLFQSIHNIIINCQFTGMQGCYKLYFVCNYF